MVAIWMVGNMDTEEDKAMWWHNFNRLWDEVSKHPDLQRLVKEFEEAK